ncbi:MAG: DUF2442 domain-containing protein [Firmicutes bacterium]|nr:DUF2442 domain-containing protein [Bacillota bacterium]
MLQPKLIRVEAMDDMKLLLEYETGEKKIFDVTPYASGDWYGELKDPKYFKGVGLLPDGTGITWADGQDIAPHELYELSADL